MPDARGSLSRLMLATLADEQAHGTWTYEAVRPMPVPSSWKPGQHVIGDCSKGCQYLCRWVPGCPDPMGNGWADWGNSTTLWLHLTHLTSPAELLIGDVVTFGYDGDEHATMVLERGTDPLLWSFGHQGAPNTYRLSWDGREHQLLRLPVPLLPTHEDVLRAKTGWFAWVAWILGEGAETWKPYGPANPKVRPNVPTHIGPGGAPGTEDWWERLEKFLAARHQGNPPTTKP